MHILLEKFLVHNQFWESVERFNGHDPHLLRLSQQYYQYESSFLKEITPDIPGIYLLNGGRQIGKTTALKQLLLRILQDKIYEKDKILFLSGELILNHEELRRILQVFVQDKEPPFCIVIDEINYIDNWDRTIKYFADSLFLDTSFLVLSGSNSIVIKDAMKRFPGRRGKAEKVNYHYAPLSFKEVLNLKKVSDFSINNLYNEFYFYLQTGGFLTAINDLASNHKISNATLNTYREWIYGDFAHYNKSEKYLTEMLRGIFKRYASQITWNSLSKELSIDHHKTVSDYCLLLSQMDAVYIQSAVDQNRKTEAPKKAKKIYFSDPFIFHALYAYIHGSHQPWENEISVIKDSSYVSTLVEGIVVNHIRRKFPAYYIKDTHEIDIAYIQQRKINTVEVKWTNQIRADDLKPLRKFPHTIVAGRVDAPCVVDQIKIEPIPQFLLNW